jgi:hypothetical protein
MLRNLMRKRRQLYELKIVLVFLAVLSIHLGVAGLVYARKGCYGTLEVPYFGDARFAHPQAVLGDDVIDGDVLAKSPTLTNYLLIAPSAIARATGYRNPWTSLAFMMFFSLFCCLTAYMLLYAAETRREGFIAAVLFLVNPLTLGNAVLRRQYDSIVVFFLAVSLLLIIKRKQFAGAVAMGFTILTRLGGIILVPVAFLQERNWKYIVIPVLVAALLFVPLLVLGGKDAVTVTSAGEHLQDTFKFDGVSLCRLWNTTHDRDHAIGIRPMLAILLAGILVALALIAWKRFGLFENLTLLLAVALLLSPKLHTGYFSLLAFAMAPLVKKNGAGVLYMIIGALSLIAAYYEFPLKNMDTAFWYMAVVSALVVMLVPLLIRRSAAKNS